MPTSAPGALSNSTDSELYVTQTEPPSPRDDLLVQDEESTPTSGAEQEVSKNEWASNPANPWNWPAKKKNPQVAMLCLTALLA